jgi:endonuclease/exonuclease/phosphatase family metal-dependent hydrolase
MTEPDQASELRVLHWNIHSWRDDQEAPNLERVADLLEATDPAVVSLVEVDESWNSPSVLDKLAARCGYVSVFSPTLEFGQDEPAGGFGNAILTRLPILTVRQRQLVWPVPSYDGSEPSEPRTAVFVKVQVGAQPTWIVSTHLPRTDANTRMAAVARLAKLVQKLDAPWMLVGDFNAPAAAWITKYGALRAHPDPAVATYPTKQPVEAIDYCVAPASLRVEAEVLGVEGSDHLAVLMRSWTSD